MFQEATYDCFQFLAYLWIVIGQAGGVCFPRVRHIHSLPCNLADSSMIFISSLYCADSFEASQVHGDTDPPIDVILQSQVGQQVRWSKTG